MKLSAPPPPPPEPPEPGPTPEPAPEPHGNAVTAPVVTGTAAPRPAAKPATWPAWFEGVDTALVVLAAALGFLLASFAARNSDLWLHLGAGRMLAAGQYSLGSDPLSYTAADRPWVNHSWLFDFAAYQIYKADPAALVVIKAVAVAAALVLLVGIRRSGQAFWPWAGLAAVTAVAAAPQLTLSPFTGSVVFLAVTLFLVFRVPSPPGSWRLPIAVGVTFWLWANVDEWFILGPLALGLLLVGELVRTKLRKDAAPVPEDDPLGRLPDVTTLSRALLVGVVACMLNPHHGRVWQVPFELIGSSAVGADPLVNARLYSPLTRFYWDTPGLGFSWNGLAYAVLLAAGLYAVALSGALGRLVGSAGVDPLPAPHALLWCGFAALSLRSVYAIPFLAVVTVPLVASRLNALSAGIRLGDRANGRTRLLLTASGFGRVVSLALLLAACVAAWPGWLHPATNDPAAVRRVAWAVEPDPLLVRAAGQFQAWRDAGALPADAHGMIAAVDLANYCAWYAPAEKVFLNGRFGHHRPELPDFETVRAGLRLFPQAEYPDPKTGREVMSRRRAGYVAVSTTPADPAEVREQVRRTVGQLENAWARWAPWYLDGRTTVFGYREEAGEGGPLFDRLRLDPVRLAFGPDAERVQPGKVAPPAAEPGLVDEFIRPPRSGSPAAAEALAWLDYRDVLAQRQAFKVAAVQPLQLLLLRNVPRPSPLPLPADVSPLPVVGKVPATVESVWNAPWPDQGAAPAISTLALRAARRAIADSPDHPDGYYLLALALSDPTLPMGDDERTIGRITAYRQCLSRVPPPGELRPGAYLTSPADVARNLAREYLSPAPNGYFRGARLDLPGVKELAGEMLVLRGNQVVRIPLVAAGGLPPDARVVAGPCVLPLDLARQVYGLANEYAQVQTTRLAPDTRQAVLKEFDDERKQVEKEFQRASEQFRAAAERQPKAKDRFQIAMRTNLLGEAVTILKGFKEGELAKEFGADAPQVALQMIALELAAGWLEDADADIADLKAGFDQLAAQPRPPGNVGPLRELLRMLEYQKLLLAGDYPAAGAVLEATAGQGVGSGPYPLPADAVGIDWPIVSAVPSLDTAAMMGFWARLRDVQFAQARQRMYNLMNRESQFFYRRGALSLLEGDVAAARIRFGQSRRPAPPGWDLPELRHPQAEAYLQLIKAAEKASTK